MTNAEVYIGDEDLIDQFIDEFNEFACEQDCDFKYHYLKEMLVKFFQQEAKPKLTDDERVILRNLHYEKGAYEYERIGRTRKDSEGYSDLYLIEKDLTITNFNEYIHLFQFIKERRRI